MEAEGLIDTIGAIYDAALSVDGWRDTMDRVAACTGANGGLLLVRDNLSRDLNISAMSNRYNLWDGDAYLEHMAEGEEVRWLEALGEAPARTILTDEEVWPDRNVYDAIPAVRWMRNLRLYHRCAARLTEHSGWWDCVALLFAQDRAGIAAPERRAFTTLLPHLSRVVSLQRPFVLLERRFRAVLTMLDRLGIGVMLLDPGNRIVLANREAERILDDNEGCGRDRHGRLTVPGVPGWSRTLSQLLADPVDRHLSITVPRTDGGEALMLDLMHIQDLDDLGEPFDGALCLLIDPDHRAMVSTEGLAKSYGLTPAELAVCALLTDGLSSSEIAEARGVSVGTVKSQTLAIFRKTQTRNRSELIRRALSITPPILDEDGRRQP